MTTLFDDPRVADLLGGDLAGVIASTFANIAIAEEEIARARGSSEVDRDDPLWNAFMLLQATHDLMQTEFVYRSHCREILERVKRADDTRPGTDAEIACHISDGSMHVPLAGELVALQMRIFERAFPDKAREVGVDLDLYERMHGPGADEWERKLRRKLRQDWRKATKEETTA